MDFKFYCFIIIFEDVLRILENLDIFGIGWYLYDGDFIVVGIRFGIVEPIQAEKMGGGLEAWILKFEKILQ